MNDESDYEEISYSDVSSDNEEDDDNDDDEKRKQEPSLVVAPNKHSEEHHRDAAAAATTAATTSSTPLRVQVEIPPSLLEKDKGKGNRPSTNHEPQSEVSSLASSFVNLTSRALTVKSSSLQPPPDESSPSCSLSTSHNSWTEVVSSTETRTTLLPRDETKEEQSNITYTYNDSEEEEEEEEEETTTREWDDLKSLESSVYSNFELLNLEGNFILRCRKCSYHNEDTTARWCAACGIALVANPCLDMDHQIALSFKRKYELEELALLRQAEQARQSWSTKPLLERATVLQQELSSFINTIIRTQRKPQHQPNQRRISSLATCKAKYLNGILFPSATNLRLLLSTFIERVDQADDQIVVAYVCATDADQQTALRILQNNCADDETSSSVGVQVCRNLEVALSHGRNTNTHARAHCPRNSLHRALASIPEDGNDNKKDDHEVVGILVAVVNHTTAAVQTVPAPSRYAGILTIKSPLDILPLASFDINLQLDDILLRLMNGFTRILHDTFHVVPVMDYNTTQHATAGAAAEASISPSSKRHKPETTDDASVASSTINAFQKLGVDSASSPATSSFEDSESKSAAASTTKTSQGTEVDDLRKVTLKELGSILVEKYHVPTEEVEKMSRWERLDQIKKYWQAIPRDDASSEATSNVGAMRNLELSKLKPVAFSSQLHASKVAATSPGSLVSSVLHVPSPDWPKPPSDQPSEIDTLDGNLEDLKGVKLAEFPLDDLFVPPESAETAAAALQDSFWEDGAKVVGDSKPIASSTVDPCATKKVTLDSYNENDVVFIDGFSYGEHEGNIRYELALNEHASRFGRTTDTTKRDDIVSTVTGLLRQDGKVLENGRNGGWKVMTDTDLRVQVGKDLWALYRKVLSFESASSNKKATEQTFPSTQQRSKDWESKSI